MFKWFKPTKEPTTESLLADALFEKMTEGYMSNRLSSCSYGVAGIWSDDSVDVFIKPDWDGQYYAVVFDKSNQDQRIDLGCSSYDLGHKMEPYIHEMERHRRLEDQKREQEARQKLLLSLMGEHRC